MQGSSAMTVALRSQCGPTTLSSPKHLPDSMKTERKTYVFQSCIFYVYFSPIIGKITQFSEQIKIMQRGGLRLCLTRVQILSIQILSATLIASGYHKVAAITPVDRSSNRLLKLLVPSLEIQIQECHRCLQ